MTVRAALLDNHGVYQRMEELADPADLTLRHLPQITSCDLPPGEYKWIADERNPYGGAFWPLKWLKRVEQDRLDVDNAKAASARLAARRSERKTGRGE